MYKLRTLIFLFIVFFPGFIFSQGFRLELLEETPRGEGFIGYTGTSGRQVYTKLDSLLATFGYISAEVDGDTINEIQIFSVSDRIVGTDTLGATIEASENGGEFYIEQGNNITIRRIGNRINISGLGPDDIQTFRDYISGGSLSGNTLNLTGVGVAGASISLANISPSWSNLTGVPAGFVDGVDNDTNTQLSTEQVQDAIGTMFAGNTETRITVTYDDAGNEIDFIVTAPTWSSLTGVPAGFSDGVDNNTQLSTEQVQDAIGTMFAGNTETGITVTYDDTWNEIDFIVTAPTWSSLTGVPAGFADGVDNDTNTQLSTEQVQDAIGTMFAGNTETRITVTYDDTWNEIDFIVTAPAWSSLTGVPAGFADGVDNDTNTQLSTEQVQDAIGTMFAGNTETGITVTYDDVGNEIDFVVTSGGTYTGSNGIGLFGSDFQLDVNNLSNESSPVTGDYLLLFDVSQNTENKVLISNLASIVADGNTTYTASDGIFLSGTDIRFNSFVFTEHTTLTDSDYIFFGDLSQNNERKITFANFKTAIGAGTGDGNNFPTSFTTINNNVLTLNRSGLTPITTDLSPLQANWNLVFNKPSTFASNWNTMSNIPSGFSDGVDNSGVSIAYQDVTGGADPDVLGLTSNDEVHISIQNSSGNSQLFLPDPSSTYRGKRAYATSFNTGSGQYTWTCLGGNSDIMYKGATGSVAITDNSPTVAICMKYAQGSTTYFWQIYKSN